jgi:transposase
MTIRLHLRRMRVVRVLEDEIDRLVIEVADTRPVVRCPACGDKTSKVHETRRVEFRDLPLGRPAPLVWLRRRFECPNCGHRHTEDHPEIEGKVTRRLARSLVRDSKYLTIRELSRRHRLSWHLIMGWCGPGRRSWGTVDARAGVGCCCSRVVSMDI